MVDVAAQAGVSYQTVSRVVNGHPSVAEETRRRVQAVIDNLQFRPNNAARALVTGRGTTIAVFAGNTTLFGYAGTLEGIEQAARASGLTVMITVLDQATPEEMRAAVIAATTQPLAGVICLTHDSAGRRALELVPRGLSAIGVGGVTGAGHACAVVAEREGASAATAHLLELGHQTVHHVAIPSEDGEATRARGWRETLQAVHRRVPAMVKATWLPRSGYEAGLLLGRRRGATAILAGNDDLAVGLIRGLFDSGLRVPEDVSVVGFDNQPFTEFTRPALTTVQQSFPDIGRAAVGLLQSRIADPTLAPETVSVPAPLVVRESTARAKAT